LAVAFVVDPRSSKGIGMTPARSSAKAPVTPHEATAKIGRLCVHLSPMPLVQRKFGFAAKIGRVIFLSYKALGETLWRPTTESPQMMTLLATS
jgi:hypothetical protein